MEDPVDLDIGEDFVPFTYNHLVVRYADRRRPSRGQPVAPDASTRFGGRLNASRIMSCATDGAPARVPTAAVAPTKRSSSSCRSMASARSMREVNFCGR